MSCQDIKPTKMPKCEPSKYKPKYSFNFEEKVAYLDGMYYGKIISHTDTVIEVELETQEKEKIIHEFRLYVPNENDKKNN